MKFVLNLLIKTLLLLLQDACPLKLTGIHFINANGTIMKLLRFFQIFISKKFYEMVLRFDIILRNDFSKLAFNSTVLWEVLIAWAGLCNCSIESLQRCYIMGNDKWTYYWIKVVKIQPFNWYKILILNQGCNIETIFFSSD